jgi:hypothetical protein
MNNTNRFLNRTFSFIVGLILAAVGVGVILVVTIPQVRDAYKNTAPTVLDNVTSWFVAAPIPGLQHSWWFIALIAALVLLIILLMVFVFRQGHGHTGTLFTNTPTGQGHITVDSKVAEQLMQSALNEHTELVSSRVSIYEVNGTPVLKISTTARRGVSPKQIVEDVEDTLASLNVLLGRDVPAAVQIGGGFRAATSKPARLR